MHHTLGEEESLKLFTSSSRMTQDDVCGLHYTVNLHLLKRILIVHMVDGGKKKKEGIKKLLGGKDDYDDDVIFQMIKSR